MGHRPFTALIATCLLVTGCASGSEPDDDAEPTTLPSSTASSATITVAPIPSAEAPAPDGSIAAPTDTGEPATSDVPGETSNPDVVSRRTTVVDVDVWTGAEIRGYQRAAVPVDAWPASAVGVDRFSTETPTDPLVVEHDLANICVLIAVWALPHPDFLVIGYEEHPGDFDCDVSDVSVTFEIDRSGLNSEGAWDYGDGAGLEIRELPRFGTGS